jgi:hypothetical protein
LAAERLSPENLEKKERKKCINVFGTLMLSPSDVNNVESTVESELMAAFAPMHLTPMEFYQLSMHLPTK